MKYDEEYIEKLIQGADDGKLLNQRELAEYLLDQYKKCKADIDCETYATLIKRAEKNDIYAMVEIANAYRDGTFVEQSDEQYYKWLERIVKDHKYVYYNLKHLYKSSNIWEQQGRFQQGELFGELIYPYGDSAYALGLYYLGSSEIKELEQALFYFEAADLCWIPCEKYIVQVKKRIEALQNSRTCAEEEEDEIIVEESKQLIDEFGLETWNKLASQSKKYLITAMFCYEQLDSLNERSKQQIDFSAAILPMMKALELELKKRFYVQYIDFLKVEFPTPEAYMQKIGITKAKDRDVILNINRDGNISFTNTQQSEKFTLGSFRFCMGVINFHKTNGTYCDCTAIQFAKNVLLDLDVFNQTLENNSDIDEQVDIWLWNLINDVCAIKQKRNESAHSGEVLNQTDAEFCLAEIITVKKIIRNLVYMCR